MTVNMKKCKECGKLFTPKGRESYCSDKHYRPCPICGEPAEVLYFADPPRRCDKCRGKKSVQPLTTIKKLIDKPAAVQPAKKTKKSSSEDSDKAFVANVKKHDKKIELIIKKSFPAVDMEKDELVNQDHVWTYVGQPTKNSFIPGHTYSIKVSNDRAAYIVTSDEDMTAGQIVNIYDRFSSIIMLNKYFVKSIPS